MRYTHEVNACALTCALAVIVWSIVLHHIQMFRGRRLCPGPRHTRRSLLLPWRWFLRPRCGYDLTGLRPTSTGEITCPECARRLPSIERASTHTRRIRWQFLLLSLITLSWSGLSLPSIRDGDWIATTPDWVLVTHQRLLRHHGMGRLTRELQSRIENRTLAPEATDHAIPAFIAELPRQREPWYTEQAVDALAAIGRPAMPALEQALDSPDQHTRINASRALRRILFDLPVSAFPPSRRLLRVTIESLHSGSMVDSFSSNTGALNFFTSVGELAEPVFLSAMRGHDEQARLMAAGACGFARRTALLPDAAPILLDHLRNNTISDDGMFASAALRAFGPDALPYLESVQNSTDPQQRKTAQLIALNLIAVERDSPELRESLQVLSHIHDDPTRLGDENGYHGWLPSIAAPAATR